MVFDLKKSKADKIFDCEKILVRRARNYAGNKVAGLDLEATFSVLYGYQIEYLTKLGFSSFLANKILKKYF